MSGVALAHNITKVLQRIEIEELKADRILGKDDLKASLYAKAEERRVTLGVAREWITAALRDSGVKPNFEPVLSSGGEVLPALLGGNDDEG